MEFSYYMPTRVIQGNNCISKNRDVLLSLGKKAMIVTGKTSAKINGSLSDITSVLDDLGIAFVVFDEVEPNPSVETVQRAAGIAREFEADFVIGIGGGSPLDAAKAVCILSRNVLEGEAVFAGDYSEPFLANVAVPTTAGTGSEVTQYAILTDKSAQTKRNISSANNFPKVAFLDARYTSSVNKTTTINTAVDALSHSVEGYLARRSGALPDAIAKESIQILGRILPGLTGLVDFNMREQLLYASMLAGIVIAQAGTTAVHAVGYQLTYFRHIDHGRANALVMAEYLEFVSKGQPEKVETILSLMNLSDLGAFKSLIDGLMGPKEVLTEKEVVLFSASAMQQGNIKNTIPEPDQESLKQWYRNSLDLID
ncbi:MAG: iron-containing alcohol dehydrogenase family protein [Pseudomonadota bacterium]